MLRVVLIQFVTSLVVAAVAAVAWGTHAGISALLGGGACWLPNGLFAMNLALLEQRRTRLQASPREQQGSTTVPAVVWPILLGELFKVVLIAGLLSLVVWTYHDVVWGALIAAVSAVLLVQPAALAWTGR